MKQWIASTLALMALAGCEVQPSSQARLDNFGYDPTRAYIAVPSDSRLARYVLTFCPISGNGQFGGDTCTGAAVPRTSYGILAAAPAVVMGDRPRFIVYETLVPRTGAYALLGGIYGNDRLAIRERSVAFNLAPGTVAVIVSDENASPEATIRMQESIKGLFGASLGPSAANVNVNFAQDIDVDCRPSMLADQLCQVQR